LYPFFARVVNFVTKIVLWPVSWQATSDLYQPHYSGASLRVLMLLQHTLTILAISYFAVTIAKSFWTRVTVAALLYFQPFMLVFTHSVLTEGLSFALLCAATAELVKFSRFDGRHRAALARFYLLIGIASLIKHVFIVFVGAPFGCVLVMSLSRHTRERLVQGQPLVEAKHLLFGLVGVLAVTQVMTNEAMRLMDIEPRSAIGRVFVYRLSPGRTPGEVGFGAHQFFRSDAERSAIVEELKERADDDTLRRVIDIVGRTRKPWVDPWNAVERFVTTECLADVCQRHPWAVTDELLNSVARHAIVSADVRLWRDVGLRILQFVAPMLVDSERQWAICQRIGCESNETVVGLSSSTLVTYPLRIERDLGLVIAIGYIFAELGGLLGLLAVAVITVRMKQILVIPTTLLASGLIYAIAVSVVTVYLPRYGDVVWLVALLATIVAVLELQAWMRSSQAIVGDASKRPPFP
jgi:hypothetical protein